MLQPLKFGESPKSDFGKSPARKHDSANVPFHPENFVEFGKCPCHVMIRTWDLLITSSQLSLPLLSPSSPSPSVQDELPDLPDPKGDSSTQNSTHVISISDEETEAGKSFLQHGYYKPFFHTILRIVKIDILNLT